MDAGVASTGSFIPLPGYREITGRQQIGKPGPSGKGVTIATAGRWAVGQSQTPCLTLPLLRE